MSLRFELPVIKRLMRQSLKQFFNITALKHLIWILSTMCGSHCGSQLTLRTQNHTAPTGVSIITLATKSTHIFLCWHLMPPLELVLQSRFRVFWSATQRL